MKTLRSWTAASLRVAFYCLMGAGLWLMYSASASYLELGEIHPFFLEKLPLAHPTLWLGALYVHVPTALLALPACMVLLIGRVRSHFPRFHRWLGRITAAVVVFAVVPSGMYLALFAQGGLMSTLGFWLTGLITFVAMVNSVRAARARDMKAHRRFSTHVVAQLAVAVVSRFLLVGAEELGLYSPWVYIAALWVPVLACAVIAEVLTGPRLLPNVFPRSKGVRHEALVAVSHLDAVR
jgi:uncharacterized membrane protein